MASAQSSVTLFGIVDAGVSYYQDKPTTGASTSSWKQSSSGYNSSRLGFRGTEDLGGGLAASFWLEAGLGNDTGTAGGTGTVTGTSTSSSQLFNRRSTLSLSGAFGEVRIGRDYTASFWNDTVFDPFGTNGVGSSAIFAAHSAVLVAQGAVSNGSNESNYVRANNMVGYFLPSNLGGFYGQAQYAFHENNKVDNSTAYNSKASQYTGARFGYANGPLDVAVAYGESTVTDASATNGSKAKTANLGASYDLGVVKLFGELSRVTTDFNSVQAVFGTDSVDLNGALIGVTAPIGAGLIRASFSTVKMKADDATGPKSNKFALGYVHNLSKRTALYATAAYTKNKDSFGTYGLTSGSVYGIGASKSSTGYDFGIRHSF